MTVGANQRVREINVFLVVTAHVHAASKVLEIDLMNDADAGRDNLEGVEGLHAPFHELIALLVARKLELHVQIERIRCTEVVDHHRVVDHQIDRHQRLDSLGILAHLTGHPAHRCQVGQQRHTGKVLKHDTGDDEGDLIDPVGARLPVGELLDMLLGHLLAIDIAQHGLQHDANRDRQALDIREGLGERGQRIELATAAAARFEVLESLECVMCHVLPVFVRG